ncbi:hypothetical protein KKB99_08555, partial [bacterium]|nr:hypothetical protein [bacterium]MBU1026041.1 hypothetical protein [bacterium]
MKRKAIFLAFVLAMLTLTPSIGKPQEYSPQFLNEKELVALDECLMNLKMDRSDLRFKRDYADDEYRMDICQKVLEEPLYAPDYSDSLYQWILENGSNLEKVTLRAFEDIDYKPDDGCFGHVLQKPGIAVSN